MRDGGICLRSVHDAIATGVAPTREDALDGDRAGLLEAVRTFRASDAARGGAQAEGGEQQREESEHRG